MKLSNERTQPARLAIAGPAALIAAGDPAGATDRRSQRSVESIEQRTAGEPAMAIVSSAQPAHHRRRIGGRSSGLDVAEEGFDLTSHRLGLPGQLAGCLENLMGRGAGIAGGLLNTGNVG
jgi:hypothetical protein